MTPSQEVLDDTGTAWRPPENCQKSKKKRILSSLRRLLGKSPSQLRDSPGSPSATPSSPPCGSQAAGSNFAEHTMDSNAPTGTKAAPRPVNSMPLLRLPEQGLSTARSGPWPFLNSKLPPSHQSARKLAHTPSMSALTPGMPNVDLCGPAFSTGAMANSVISSGVYSNVSAVSSSAHELFEDCVASTVGQDVPTATASNTVSTSTTTSATLVAAAAHTAATRQQEGAEVLLSHGWNSSLPMNIHACTSVNRPLPAVRGNGNSPLALSAPAASASAEVASVASVSASARASASASPAAVSGNCPPAAVAAVATAAATTTTAGPATAPASTLLAMCPAAPEAMRRSVWRLADYTISGRLYKGEVSAVYKAVCGLSGSRVVLKVYSLSRVADNALHTLVREVRIHTQLDHENVLCMYGVFEEDNRLILVLERALRGDLLAVRATLPRGRMSEDQLRVLVLAPLLDALVYLHGRGVCHRDIKPENLLMSGGWQLRVADFGAAIDLTQERAVTRTGTMDYMAPEVERCPLKLLPEDNKNNPDLAYTTAADVWSVGVLAYEMLVGFPPFINCTAGTGEEEGGAGGGGGMGGGGAGAVGRRELCFPHFVSAGGQDFISLALAERPMDRPTAAELLRHPWLKHAVRQHHARRQQAQQQQAQQQLAQPQQAQLQAQQQAQQQAQHQQHLSRHLSLMDLPESSGAPSQRQQQHHPGLAPAPPPLPVQQQQQDLLRAQSSSQEGALAGMPRFTRTSRLGPREGLSRLHMNSASNNRM